MSLGQPVQQNARLTLKPNPLHAAGICSSAPRVPMGQGSADQAASNRSKHQGVKQDGCAPSLPAASSMHAGPQPAIRHTQNVGSAAPAGSKPTVTKQTSSPRADGGKENPKGKKKPWAPASGLAHSKTVAAQKVTPAMSVSVQGSSSGTANAGSKKGSQAHASAAKGGGNSGSKQTSKSSCKSADSPQAQPASKMSQKISRTASVKYVPFYFPDTAEGKQEVGSQQPNGASKGNKQARSAQNPSSLKSPKPQGRQATAAHADALKDAAPACNAVHEEARTGNSAQSLLVHPRQGGIPIKASDRVVTISGYPANLALSHSQMHAAASAALFGRVACVSVHHAWEGSWKPRACVVFCDSTSVEKISGRQLHLAPGTSVIAGTWQRSSAPKEPILDVPGQAPQAPDLFSP